MIKPDAALSIKLIPISCLQVKEEKWRYQHTVDGYIRLLNVRPKDYLGFLSVTPSDTHPGMYCLLDGHHRYIAYVIAGRHDALCVIIEEVDEDENSLGEERKGTAMSKQQQSSPRPDMRRSEHNPLAGTGFPAQPKATNPPTLYHLKNLTEHRVRKQMQKGYTDGRTTEPRNIGRQTLEGQ